jgi:hypothetical protein
VLLILPIFFRSTAAGPKNLGLFRKTVSHDPSLPNYDIRTDKAAHDKVAQVRAAANTATLDVAYIRDGFVKGENSLAQKVPTLKVEYNSDIHVPEVITINSASRTDALIDSPAGSRADVLKSFVRGNDALFGTSDTQVTDLKVAADYTNPDGNLSFVELDQEINGIPVFRGSVKAGFKKNGEMFRVINNLAPGLDYALVSDDFGDPAAAVQAASGFINRPAQTDDLTPSSSTSLKSVFGTGDWATTAEKMYFPTEPGVVVPAWRVLIWEPVNAYYVIVDAKSGTMLWRKNISEDQTQSATYNVYVNPNAMINVAENPFPFTPGPILPNGQQGAGIARS